MHKEAHTISLMHLKKGLEHFRSNGYLSWLHYIPFSVLRGYWRSCILCAILRDNWCGRSCSEIHEWQKDALGSSYQHFNATKEGFGALQEQRMYLLVAQYLISVLRGQYWRSGILCAIWESTVVENGTVRPISGWQIPSTASLIFLLHLRQVYNNSYAMNVSSYSSHSTFSILRGYPKLAIC